MKFAPHIRLLAYPALEMTFFFLAVFYFEENWVMSVFFLLTGSIFLSYALHITFHELVHQTGYKPANRWLSFLATVFTGVPLDGYRLHHMSHHRYNNNFRDYSSTWSLARGKLEPRNLLIYGFTWPRHPLHVHRSMRFKHRRKLVPAILLTRISEQKFVLPTVMLLLGVYSLWAALLYAVLIYLGWSCTTFHNYLQHPPLRSNTTQSIYNKTYNTLTSNNGLHFEHHSAPGIAWHLLQPSQNQGADA